MSSDGWNVKPIGHSNLNGHGDGGQVVVQRIDRNYYAYVGHMEGMGTTIVDVTTPDRPEVLSQVKVPQNIHSHKVRVFGNLMFVNYEQLGSRTPSEVGLKVFDISDRTAPEEKAFFKTGGMGVHRFWVDGEAGLAYLSTGMDGYMRNIFLILDVSDPAKPQEVSRWWVPGQWTAGGEKPTWAPKRKDINHHGPVVLRDRAYLGYWDGGFIILDISDIRRPRFVSRGDYNPPYGGFTHTAIPIARKIMGRSWLIVFEEETFQGPSAVEKRVWVVDVTEETNPVSVATFPAPSKGLRNIVGRFGPHQPYEDVNAEENLIYAAWFSAGLRIFDVSNPYRPSEVGYYVPPTPRGQEAIQTNDVFVDDRGLIYIIDRFNGGLEILEYTGPSRR